MIREKTELKVEGMDCANCATSISRFLERKGLEDVLVNYATGDVRFRAGSGDLDLESVKAGIEKLGYKVIDPKSGSSKEWWNLEKKLWISVIFTAPLLLHHILMVFGITLFEPLHNPWVQFAICLPVFLIGFFHFGTSAFASLRGGVPNMDVLIFLGSTAAFIYSLIGTFLQEPDYIFYETSATIITLVLLGNWLEKRSVKQTTTAIDELSKLKSETARKIMPSGTVITIPQDEINVGDLLQVNEGDQVPTDGKIESSSESVRVDESMLTGESIPVEKAGGDTVIGGSINIAGNFRMKATATGNHTVLSRMIELVKTAQQEKPDIQRLADKISAIFVPVVVGIALLTFLIAYFGFNIPAQQALMNSIAVLVISCPCAMGLATPTAVMVGVGRMAKNGILVKGGQTLEIFAGIRNFVFDKTGTLTTGRFKLKNLQVKGEDEEKVKNIILTLENHSSHPIAQSLVQELNGQGGNGFFISGFKETRGLGVEAHDEEGNIYKIGSSKILATPAENGDHDLYLTKNDIIIATLDITDDVKEPVHAVIQSIKDQGGKTILLSGDREPATRAVAEQVGIDDWYGEKKPEEKLELIGEWSKEAPTAMIGDGINDAPALAKATIGVSLSDASRVAIQSAQVVLLNGRLESLTKALAISKHTLLTIKQNLFWAFAYNIVAIPIAAMGFLNPMWAALFMALSDVIVIGNSIRLKTKRIF